MDGHASCFDRAQPSGQLRTPASARLRAVRPPPPSPLRPPPPRPQAGHRLRRRRFAGKPAHDRLVPLALASAGGHLGLAGMKRPPQARKQWPCPGESGSEARSRTREPSKASSECAAAHTHESDCVNVSRSPAEPVEAWHGFSCRARHGTYSESRAPSLGFVPSSQSPGIAVLVSHAGGCK
jgi:hypothetical protein